MSMSEPIRSVREAYQLLLKKAFPYKGWPKNRDEEVATRIMNAVVDYIEDKNININVKKKKKG